MKSKQCCKRVSKYLMSCRGVKGMRWQLQREGLVRTRKESDRVKATHPLEKTCWDTERKLLRKEHKLGDHRGRGR